MEDRGLREMLDDLMVFHGEASTTLGRVYARLLVAEEPADCELTGRVVGPRCRWANTLPAGSKLVQVKQDGGTGYLLAEAVVPDPCFWSDEVPMLYDVHVELRRGGETIGRAERSVGFRGVGRRGRSLFRQGKRWVPRGMYLDAVVTSERDDLAAWRAAPAVMVVESPSDAICMAASEMGLWIVADLEGFETSTAIRTAGQASSGTRTALARLSHHSAVFLAILPEGVSATQELRGLAPNLLLAERAQSVAIVQVSPDADCVWLDANDLDAFAAAARMTTLPVIAHRALGATRSLSESRRACDDLQRDLAAIGDFAGYVISLNPES
jgi:hypothetical protein